MDPLMVFPPEIVQKIWRHLEPRDLLSARAVAHHWLASIGDCPGAWVTDFSQDWTEFLAFKQAIKGWSSKNIRRQTFRNVKDCVFAEFAYYLLFGNGALGMFSPDGNPVRFFDHRVTALHRGSKCLLIGIEDVIAQRSVHVQQQKTRYCTIITDFVLNCIDELLEVEITTSSPNGYSYIQDSESYFSVGFEIPAMLKIPFTSDTLLHFLASSVVSVQGFTVKTVQFFDPARGTSVNLKRLASSPRWIPSVDIQPGLDDYFSITVEQRDFNTISVYCRDTLLYEDSFPSTFKSIFTDKYFILSLHDTVMAFNLKDFSKHWNLELPVHLNTKLIKCEMWSLFRNIMVIFNLNAWGLSDLTHWLVYRLEDHENVVNMGEANVALNSGPRLKLLAANSTPVIQACVFCETTFYLLFDDDSLIMFNHIGQPIRTFEGRVYSVLSGRGGLFISVQLEAAAKSGQCVDCMHNQDNKQEKCLISMDGGRRSWPKLNKLWTTSGSRNEAMGNHFESSVQVPQNDCLEFIPVPTWKKNKITNDLHQNNGGIEPESSQLTPSVSVTHKEHSPPQYDWGKNAERLKNDCNNRYKCKNMAQCVPSAHSESTSNDSIDHLKTEIKNQASGGNRPNSSTSPLQNPPSYSARNKLKNNCTNMKIPNNKLSKPPQSNKIKPPEQPSVDTYFTDLLLNIVDTHPGFQIISGHENGLLFNQNGHTFLDISGTTILCQRSEFDLQPNRIAFCSEFLVTIRGLIDKQVAHYDSKLFCHQSLVAEYQPTVLQLFKASPMTIPHVIITDQNDPFFCLNAEIGHFTKVFVYSGRDLMYEQILESRPGLSHFFTDNFFIAVSSSVTVYPLSNFEENWTYKIDLLKSQIVGKGLLTPHVPDCFAAFDATTENLDFYCINNAKRLITKMGALGQIDGMGQCFANYGYNRMSEGRLQMYYFSPD